ncbi:MAG: DUF6597 domain-containing transcriptional factor [Myxococcota bacterium]
MSERLFLRLDEDSVQAPEAEAPAGSLRAWPVSEKLRGYVAHVLGYREVVPAGHEIVERVLPDGAVRLIVNLGDAPGVDEGGGRQLEVIGANVEPALIRLRGRVEGLSVTLRAGAARAVLGMPAGEISGQAISIESVWGSAGRELGERLLGAGDDSARVVLLDGWLRERLRRGAALGAKSGLSAGVSASASALRAVQLISAGEGQRSLREVAESVGVGERRLQQLFHAEVGLSPRAVSRLARLQACLRALRRVRPLLAGVDAGAGDRDGPRWAELALERGFYDQSHLVNEFRAFSGLTPTEFFRRTISGSSKTLP